MREPDCVYFAPGRVNLIGEHTDYNGGCVFPCALSMGTYAAVKLRDDNVIRLYSANFSTDGIIETNLEQIHEDRNFGWAQYPIGVMKSYISHSYVIPKGLDIVYSGDIPTGSGLSSSASIEVLTATVLKEIFNYSDMSMIDVAKLSQYSENVYNGVNCGIMDQFASAMGKRGHAIFLDTNSLRYEYAPLELENESLIIVNSMVKHKLSESGYNDRRKECAKALDYIREVKNIDYLCKLDKDEFDDIKTVIKDDLIQKRAKHVIYENERVKQALSALKDGDYTSFGRLMNLSHISLRDDYEVSCKELDLLVDIAGDTDGVLGSRMSGGGFGGCTVNLVKKESADQFIDAIDKRYYEKTNIHPDIYEASCGAGARRIE